MQLILGIIQLWEFFSRHGVLETLVSDNVPLYASQEFTNFASSYEFCHVMCSPHFPQSNGQAEKTVKAIKKLLNESRDLHNVMALLTYWSTPFPRCGCSPAELLMGRQLCGNLSLTKKQMCPQWPYLEDFKQQNKRFKSKQK